MSALRILVVCTANVCRSPMGEALLRRRLEERGIPCKIASAGVRATGQPTHPLVVSTLAEGWGIAMGERRAIRVSPDMIDAADVVIAMAQEHVREIATMVPEAWPKTFTLREIVRRGSEAGIREPDTRLHEWLQRLSRDRRPTDLLGARWRQDDTDDPIGHGETIFRKTAEDLDDLTRKLVALAWP